MAKKMMNQTAKKKTKTKKKIAKKTTTKKAKVIDKSKKLKGIKKTTKKNVTKQAVPNKKAKRPTKKVGVETTMSQSFASEASQISMGTDPLLGKSIPHFTCLDSKGILFELAKQKGKKTVFYFYPKDDTPGCTIEGKEFSDLHSEFQKLNTDVFGISRDSVKSHDKFKCKYGFHFELLSDENEAICKIFDVIKEKNMYGKMVMGIERSTFILDEDLKVIYAERKVKAEGHAAQILERVR